MLPIRSPSAVPRRLTVQPLSRLAAMSSLDPLASPPVGFHAAGRPNVVRHITSIDVDPRFSGSPIIAQSLLESPSHRIPCGSESNRVTTTKFPLKSTDLEIISSIHYNRPHVRTEISASPKHRLFCCILVYRRPHAAIYTAHALPGYVGCRPPLGD